MYVYTRERATHKDSSGMMAVITLVYVKMLNKDFIDVVEGMFLLGGWKLKKNGVHNTGITQKGVGPQYWDYD